jgi:hypothetical protein
VKNLFAKFINRVTLAIYRKTIATRDSDVCVVFGGGYSIKYMDITRLDFGDKIAINLFPGHNGFNDSFKYVLFPDPWVFLPKLFRKNSSRINDFKPLKSLYKSYIKKYFKVQFIFHISNWMALRISHQNVIPIYNSFSSRILAKEESICIGSFELSLHFIKNQGYKKAYFVGFDAFTLSPYTNLRWLQDSVNPKMRIESTNFENQLDCLIKDVSASCELFTVGINVKSAHPSFYYCEYGDLAADKPSLKSACQIADSKLIDSLKLINRKLDD